MKTLLQYTLCATVIFGASACGNPQHSLPDDSRSEEEAIREDGTGDVDVAQKAASEMRAATFTPSEQQQILAKYDYLDPNRVVPSGLLKKAVLYYEANKNSLGNRKFITVIDFAKKSSKQRLFVVDMNNGSVWAMRTAHGQGSDTNHDGFANAFSNVSGSHKSSLGFYKTAETYSGKHGYSLRLDGLSSTNSNARARAIVIHGASYVQEANVIQGRSHGCPAVTMANRTKLIDKIKGGSIIYAGRSTL